MRVLALSLNTAKRIELLVRVKKQEAPFYNNITNKIGSCRSRVELYRFISRWREECHVWTTRKLKTNFFLLLLTLYHDHGYGMTKDIQDTPFAIATGALYFD